MWLPLIRCDWTLIKDDYRSMVILCQTTEAPGLISLSRFPMTGQEMCLDKMPAAWFGKKKRQSRTADYLGNLSPHFFSCCLQTFFLYCQTFTELTWISLCLRIILSKGATGVQRWMILVECILYRSLLLPFGSFYSCCRQKVGSMKTNFGEIYCLDCVHWDNTELINVTPLK